MVLVSWSDDFSVGIGHIDGQHRRWMDLINVLHDAMVRGETDDVVDAVLLDVLEYTRTHFQEEETLMERFAFPGFQAHKHVHDAFVGQLREKMATGPTESAALSMDALHLMRDWLVRHIQHMDQDYAAYLQDKLASEPLVQEPARAPSMLGPACRPTRCWTPPFQRPSQRKPNLPV